MMGWLKSNTVHSQDQEGENTAGNDGQERRSTLRPVISFLVFPSGSPSHYSYPSLARDSVILCLHLGTRHLQSPLTSVVREAWSGQHYYLCLVQHFNHILTIRFVLNQRMELDTG